MWKDLVWGIIDSETTGLKASEEKIIEIGCVKMKSGQILESFDALVNPGRPLTPFIMNLTGITNEELADKPSFAHYIPQLNKFMLECDVIIAYNVPFDMAFYGLEYNNAGHQMPERHWLDPLVWVRKLDGQSSNKLVECAERYQIKVANAHRASGDAEMTAHLTLKLSERLPDDLSQLVSMQDLWRREQDAKYAKKYSARR